jgi:hypothetical protein
MQNQNPEFIILGGAAQDSVLETGEETEEEESAPEFKYSSIKSMVMARNYIKYTISESFDADPQTEQYKEYIKIYNDICAFIKKNCIHEYVDDYVDLDCDRGGYYITYCKICDETVNKSIFLRSSSAAAAAEQRT